MKVYFNHPVIAGNERDYVESAIKGGRMAGDGDFTRKCSEELSRLTGGSHSLLTHSCTAALEMAAILCDLEPGDEVIVPSYTFVSTANAFVLLGAKIVFVDICSDTLNINPLLIEEAITPKTKAIVPVHYAGVACDMDSINLIAEKYGLLVIEDAAQGIMSSYKGRMLGSIGDLGTYSFHETKNVISGEGGALLINRKSFAQRAEIIREKGTNRSMFFRGEVDKYTWQDVGSSYLPGELVAAFLYAQLERAEHITSDRTNSWNRYYAMTEDLEYTGLLRRPIVPEYCKHNGHMFYILLENSVTRQFVLESMKSNGVQATFHYVPLHSSPAGQRYGRVSGEMSETDSLSRRLIRLPMYYGLNHTDQRLVIDALREALESL